MRRIFFCPSRGISIEYHVSPGIGRHRTLARAWPFHLSFNRLATFCMFGTSNGIRLVWTKFPRLRVVLSIISPLPCIFLVLICITLPQGGVVMFPDILVVSKPLATCSCCPGLQPPFMHRHRPPSNSPILPLSCPMLRLIHHLHSCGRSLEKDLAIYRDCFHYANC